MTAGSGGAPGSGGASSGGAPGTGGAQGTGGRGTGGATGSGGAASGGSGAGTGGRGTGGAGTGTGGRATGGAGMGTGGSAGSGAGGTAAVAFSQVATLLGMSCGTGTCHTGTDHVDLRNTAGLRDRLVGKMPAGAMTMAQCKTMTLVVAGNTASSVLSQIVKAKVTACGARMPDDCSTSGTNPRACLTTTQIAVIDNWITGGAPP